MSAKQKNFPASSLTTVSMVNMPPNLTEKSGLSGDAQNERSASSKPLQRKVQKLEGALFRRLNEPQKLLQKLKEIRHLLLLDLWLRVM